MFWQCKRHRYRSVQTQTAPRLVAATSGVLRELVAAVVAGSQVLVSVVLALAVGRRVEEGQLLPAALQLKDPTVQVQAAFEIQQSLKTQAQLECVILFDIS